MTVTAQLLGQALIAAGNVLLGNATGVATAVSQASPAAQSITAAAPVAQPVAAAAAPVATISAAAQAATDDSLTALISPHVGNDAIKAALGNAMRALGINNLPDAQPHQYSALYDAFEKVLAQFGIGAAATVAAAPVSII